MLKDEREELGEAERRTGKFFVDMGYLPDEVDEREWREERNRIMDEMRNERMRDD